LAILKQNPRFSATITSPVAALVGAIQPKMTGEEFGVLFDDEKRALVLKSMFGAYHANRIATLVSSPVIFDANRFWTGRMALIADLYTRAKVICCVWSIAWIIDSVESMLTKNPRGVHQLGSTQLEVSSSISSGLSF
jgi:sulfotransferase